MKNEYIYGSRRKAKEARLVIVAELYSKGKSYRYIQNEVMARLGIDKYSTATVHTDVETLLKEWRKSRIDDTEEAVTLALERNRQHYDMTREEWDRSRIDRSKHDSKRKGVPVGFSGGDRSADADDKKIKTILREEKETTILGEGDPRYMDLLIKLEDQRAKLLGLYAPEEKRLTGANGDPLFASNFTDIDITKLSDDEKAQLLELARKCGI